MYIIFCNIAYLRYYDGRIAGEINPTTGGRWVQENEDAHEKWNFLNMDGKCYGFVKAIEEEFHIEKFDEKYRHFDETNNVFVIWCAAHPQRGTVIVGWYENAIANRFLKEMRCTPASGIERYYWFECSAEDAYLLPEDERTFTMGRAAKDGIGKGFGQSNIWFGESAYAKEDVIPKVLEFINSHREDRINILTKEFLDTGDKTPLTKEEEEYANELTDDQNLEYLPFGYRIYANNPTADNAYAVAVALNNCYQYSMAIPWFEKTVELDPDDIYARGKLAYIYQQLEMYDKSTETVKDLLDRISDEEADLRDELYCILADNYYFDGKVEEAITWLERVLQESKNEDLISYTTDTLKKWEKRL